MLKKVHILEHISFYSNHLNYNSRSTLFFDCFQSRKGFGRLVLLGFDVTVFTPTAYLRHRL